MTVHERRQDEVFLFHRLPAGFVRVTVWSQEGARALNRGRRFHAYLPSARMASANLPLATDLLVELTGQPALASQLGWRLARKLAATFAERSSLDGLQITRRAVWRWLRWALTHPAEPPPESPLFRRPSLAARNDATAPWKPLANPLSWPRLLAQSGPEQIN
ncbi:MAG: hypothetical protein IRZ14_05435 [Chloroflexi bacterium]|nr:hypothetical protein [Chloroflexota bacterium]